MNFRRITAAALLCLFLLTGCNFLETGGTPDSSLSDSRSGSSSETFPKDTAASISFYGDLLIHDTVFAAAKKSDGSFNFENQFSAAGPYLKKSDYVVGNLETNFAGSDRGYTGYPAFNAPESMRFALRDTLGTKLIVNANNHCLDKGFSGLKSTITFLDDAGISHTGTFANPEESKKIFIADIKGIKVAFLNYTYGTNGIPLPKGNEYSVNLIDQEKIKSDAASARQIGAEFIIAVMHWGLEYHRTPSSEQTSLAAWMYQNTEVDCIIGSHPHVVQTIEEISYQRNGKEKTGLVVYSLGNFTGDQSKSYTDTGIVATVNLLKNGKTKEVSLSSCTFFPTYIDKNPGTAHNFRIINVYQGIYDYEHVADPLITKDEYTRLNVIADNYQNSVSKTSLAKMDTEVLFKKGE